MNAVLARLRLQWSSRQFRAGIDLVGSSAIGAIFGLVFWLVAARTLDVAVVGANAALLSSMVLVANLGSLGLKNGLVRFVPAFGPEAGRMVIKAYIAAGLGTMALGLTFALALGRRFDQLTLLRSAPGVLVFVLACVAWQIFGLQDNILVAQEVTKIVPIENGVYSVAKLVLLILLVFVLPEWAIFAAWVAPLIFIIGVINVGIFRRLRTTSDFPALAERLEMRDLVRFSFGDYASTIVWMGLVGLLPLVILDRAGAEANAYYQLGWTIAYNLYLVGSNIGTVLLAEATHRPVSLQAQSRSALSQMGLLIAPGALLLVAFAPLILLVFGSEYSTEGSNLLRLLALSAIAHIPVAVFVAMARAQRRLAAVFATFTVLSSLVIGLTIILLEPFGLLGVGLAWLIAELTLASVLLVTALRHVVIAMLPRRLLGALGGPRRFFNRLRAIWRLRRFEGDYALVNGRKPIRRDVLSVSADLLVIRVDIGQEADVVLKIASSEPRTAQLRAEADVLDELQGDDDLDGWKQLIAVVGDQGVIGTEFFSFQSMIDGRTTASVDIAPEAMISASRTALEPLHLATAFTTDLSQTVLVNLIDEPLAEIRRWRPKHSSAVDRLTNELRHELLDQRVVLSRIHGDYTPGNILWGPANSVVGIVDWELSRERGLPELDYVLFVLALESELEHRELGHLIAGLIRNERGELAAWPRERHATGPNEFLDLRTKVLLVWIHHVAANLLKSSVYRENEVWLARNVDAVFEALSAVSDQGVHAQSPRS